MAHEPKSRFPSLLPFTEPEECARVIIEGMRKDEEEVYVPRRLELSMKLGKVLPRRFQLACSDFLDCGVGYKY